MGDFHSWAKGILLNIIFCFTQCMELKCVCVEKLEQLKVFLEQEAG